MPIPNDSMVYSGLGLATAAPPSLVEGQAAILSVDLSGNLRTSGGGGGGGGTSSTFGSPFPTTGTAAGAIGSTGNMAGLNLDSSGNLKVSVTGAGSGGTSAVDESTFTAGTSALTPSGGVYNDGLTAITTGQQGETRITPNRAEHVNLRNNGGTEVGTLANALRIDPVGTTTQPISGTVTTTPPNHASTNVDQIGGVAIALGQTTMSASVPVAIASNQSALPVTGTFFQTTQPVSLASLPSLAAGSANIGGVELIDSAGTNKATISAAGAIKVDGSAATQPISGTVTANAGTGTFNIQSNASVNLAQVSGSSVATAATGIAKVGVTDGTGNAITSTSNALDVNIKSGGGSGFSVTDEAAWTAGTSAMVPAGGVFNDSATALSSGQEGTLRATANRGLHSNLRNSSGTEIATSSNPVRVDPTGTTSQPVSGTVTANAGTGNFATNLAQVAGATVSTGHGTAAGSIRVELPTDGTGLVNAAQSGSWTVAVSGTPTVTQTPATSGGCSEYSGSIGSTATAIKASAGQIYGYHIYNSNSTVVYVQIFDLASGSVTVGTSTPKMSLGIPPSSGATFALDSGIAFATAITFACTTTRSGSTNPSNTVDVNFSYK